MEPEQVLERLGRAALEEDLPIRAAYVIDDATDTINDLMTRLKAANAALRSYGEPER